MGLIVLPKTLTGHTPAIAAEVMADLNAIVARVNGNLEADNFADDSIIARHIADGQVSNAHLAGAITLAKMAAVGAGNVAIGDGAGLVERAVSGPVSLSSGGLTALRSYAQQMGLDVQCLAGTYTTLCAITPEAGTYLVFSKLFMYNTAQFELLARLTNGFVVVDFNTTEVVPSLGRYYDNASLMAVVVADGVSPVQLQAQGTNYLSGAPTAAWGQLLLLRVA